MATYVEADLTAIRTAITCGYKSVKFADGRSVDNQSASDLILLHNFVKRMIAVDAGTRRSSTFRLQQSGTGL